MGTPCTLIVETPIGVGVITVNYDGYPGNMLETLPKFYGTAQLAQLLIAMGDASSLGDTLEESVFYYRDRKEEWEDVKPRFYGAVQEARNEIGQYTYHFFNGKWEII